MNRADARVEAARAHLWDVIVVGAGPAGASLALQAARTGLAVLLVDRQKFPRYKVCGGCLSPRAGAELRRLGVAVVSSSLDIFELRAGGHCAELPLTDHTIAERAELDAAITYAATGAGAVLSDRTVAEVGTLGPGYRSVTLRRGTMRRTLRARVVVAAGGLGPTARPPEAKGVPARRAELVGLGAELGADAIDLQPGRVRMVVTGAGYVGVARGPRGALNVAAAVAANHLRADRARLLSEVLRAAGVDPQARVHWTGTAPLRTPPSTLMASRWLAIGDASGFSEPFTGEGIAWALEDSRRLASVLPELVEGWDPTVVASVVRRRASWRRRRQARSRVVGWLAERPAGAAMAVGALRYVPALSRLVRPAQAAGI